MYDVAAGTASAVYSALTTNPVTTVRDIGRGIASTIDTAIAAEDTPARVQVARAAEAVANASPRDIGRAVGSTAGNVALAIAPAAVASKLSGAARAGKIANSDAAMLPDVSVVPRAGPKGVDPGRHNANALARDASGKVVARQRFVSGNMTLEEQALGFPRNTLASHTKHERCAPFRLCAAVIL